MFCSSCGAEATGNFCWKCGSPLKDAPAPAPEDWSRELRYQTLIQIPNVREMVSRQAGMAEKHLSAEDFLAMFDKVVPLGVSLEKLGTLVQPIYVRMGIKTGKARTETLPQPPGTVIVAALCSLARHGQALQQVQQFEDGCLLEAALPSDMWSWKGTLYVSVHGTDAETRVEATTDIKGQMFDWGKSKRVLETLFADLKGIAA
jgi:hypothetical protein